MRTTRTIDIDIARPPGDVFDVLADLKGFGRWLDRSQTYRGTAEVSDDPIVKGSTYTDHTTGMLFSGTVLEYEPAQLLVFHQATKSGNLAITIEYRLSPTPTGTRVVRTGDIETSGVFALLHPVVVRTTVRENARTMDTLKRHLEESPA